MNKYNSNKNHKLALHHKPIVKPKVKGIKKPPPHCVTFAELWANAETGNPAPQYEDECAIRLSVTLHKVGVTMHSFSQNNPILGKNIGRIIINGLPVATRADELAKWLKTKPFCGLGNAEDVTGKDWKEKVNGRTGIIAFSGYWGANQSGGHIDLWNQTRFPYPKSSLSWHGTFGKAENFLRFGLNGNGLYEGGLHWYSPFSNLTASKKITFFEIK